MDKVVIKPEIYSFNIDSGQHVSNIAYIQWMEMARIELLNQVGMPLHEIDQQGFAPVLTRTEISYRKPLYLGDRVRVELWLTKLANISARMAFRFYRNEDELVAEASQDGLFFSLASKRPYKLSAEQKAGFARFAEAP
jgi:acyl-CoA thioester hydrolase